MLRVIGAGFGRTGTQSLQVALEQLLGGPCYHMKNVIARHPEHIETWRAAARGDAVDWERLFDGYVAAVDWPVARFYEQMLTIYPDAKFILSHRDPDRWYDSTSRTIYRVREVLSSATWRVLLSLLGQRRTFVDMVNEVVWDGTFDSLFSDRQHAIDTYEAHNDAVKHAIPTEQLLVFEARQGWGPLCGFLGLPVPDGPFPHVNDSTTVGRALRVLAAIPWVLGVLAVGALAAVVRSMF